MVAHWHVAEGSIHLQITHIYPKQYGDADAARLAAKQLLTQNYSTVYNNKPGQPRMACWPIQCNEVH